MVSPIRLYSLLIMCWTTLNLFSPARRTKRSFLFFLYLIALCFIPNLGLSQPQAQVLDQDSIQYYLQMVEAGEKQVGRAMANIGRLYQKAGRYNSALNYYDRAIPLLNGEEESIEVAILYRSKGIIYQLFGDRDEPVRYYRLARNSFLAASEIFKQFGNPSQQMTINQHLADIATKRGNFNRAVTYQNEVIRALTKLYYDSLQAQAESFNELLSQEIQSSTDTIYVDRSATSTANEQPISLFDWRHLVIFILFLALIFLVVYLVNFRRSMTDLEEQVRHAKNTRLQLQQQNEELQTLNVALTRTEKEQRRSNLTKDRLFSIISHDLRSPVNTIAGFLNILRTKLSSIGDIELRDLAMEMIQTTDRLSHFLDDLLKWSMTQLGQIKPTVERVDIKNIVEENYLLVKSRMRAKNIHFKANIPEDIDVFADKNMLRVILRNLISNAIKFTRNGGYVAVTLKKGEEGMSSLSVADDGIGMSGEKLEEIFEFRGSKINGGGKNEGAGLGLLLCKEFAEMLGGDVEVSSKLGEGTVFTVHLPSKN